MQKKPEADWEANLESSKKDEEKELEKKLTKKLGEWLLDINLTISTHSIKYIHKPTHTRSNTHNPKTTPHKHSSLIRLLASS